ncbi:MAG: tRNA lysidine(34) synthetase TilS [Oscillospiraceae bacterium]|jgi:tRNA(Ile)-lysidine synthase|nr:tRNA lysidine(34) synthetase TilS [Oscillospiraceae bacterium]
MNTFDAVHESIARHMLIMPDDSVLAGVSGGADSLCMLHILTQLREKLGFTLTASHVNHCLRGAQSDEDEALVSRYCEDWDVPLQIRRVDCAAEAKTRGVGLEECGRALRYEFFRACSISHGKIALAHTLSDRTETLIFNLTRGASLHGLCSIPYARTDTDGTKWTVIVRPLLDITRGQIEEYCAARGIEYAVDASNTDIRYARNRIRHRVLPELRTINPQLEAATARTLQSLAADDIYLQNEAAALVENCRIGFFEGLDAHFETQRLLKAPIPIRSRALRQILADLGIQITADAIIRLESVLAGGRVSVGGGVLAACRRGILKFNRELRSPKVSPAE